MYQQLAIFGEWLADNQLVALSLAAALVLMFLAVAAIVFRRLDRRVHSSSQATVRIEGLLEGVVGFIHTVDISGKLRDFENQIKAAQIEIGTQIDSSKAEIISRQQSTMVRLQEGFSRTLTELQSGLITLANKTDLQNAVSDLEELIAIAKASVFKECAAASDDLQAATTSQLLKAKADLAESIVTLKTEVSNLSKVGASLAGKVLKKHREAKEREPDDSPKELAAPSD